MRRSKILSQVHTATCNIVSSGAQTIILIVRLLRALLPKLSAVYLGLSIYIFINHHAQWEGGTEEPFQ